MTKLSLKYLRKNREFISIYEKLVVGNELDELELQAMLSIGVIMLNSEESDIVNWGYRIFVLYTLKTKHVQPLLDATLSLGYYPVYSTLMEMNFKYKNELNPEFPEPVDINIDDEENENLKSGKFFKEFYNSYVATFYYKNKVLTYEQDYFLRQFQNKSANEDVAYIAPTSYGKSEIMTEYLSRAKNICILVPTKALLAQTKSRVIKSGQVDINRKVITHYEMYDPLDKNFIAILTQERLIKLLCLNKDLKFDIAFIDEAHNLLDQDSRSNLLASAIFALKSRKKR